MTTRPLLRRTRSRAAAAAAAVAGAFAGACLVLAGCAGSLASGGGKRHGAGVTFDVSPASTAGWAALVGGRSAEAAEQFRTSIARDHDDALALFGDACLAFERGDNARAVSGYLAVLERAAADDFPRGAPPALIAMSVGRIGTLLEEHAGSENARRQLEDRLLTIRPAKLPWEARYDLALIADKTARRRGDLTGLARVAATAGCVRAISVARPAGILPHLDLDAPAPASDGPSETAPRRSVHSVGCVISVPTYEGRAGAQRVFADVEAPRAGVYELVLDFSGEARVSVDGSSVLRQGDEQRYGPRVSAARVTLAEGRHRLELRLATFGGSPSLVLMLAPATAAVEAPARTDEAVALGAAATLAQTYVANRIGDWPAAWRGAERLEGLPRFAAGLSFAAVVARDDPSRPASFGRDRARTLLRAAVAIDPAMARARHALAAIALDDERPREAIDEARAAQKAAPGWWLPELALYGAYRSRGLEWDADKALDRAVARAPGACAVVMAALARAETRRDVAGEAHFEAALGACGADNGEKVDRMRRRGDLAGAETELRRAVAMSPDRDDARLDLASVLLARHKEREAARLIAVSTEPNDAEGQIRLADALTMAGATGQARAVIAAALQARPDTPEVVHAARALGLPLPLDEFRIDGRQVIRDFEASGRKYDAPAVVVLDRSVARVFPTGAEVLLTHEIVRVQSKDAIQKWGEVAISGRSEILVLRTHKADGTTREPEEFAGKDTISAADLNIGDYVEKETLEIRPPRDAFVINGAFTGGFLGDRFYFQSFDAPLDRSEYLLITGSDTAAKMHVDARAGAPRPVQTPWPVMAVPGAGPRAVVTTFAVTRVPQLFAERFSVPSIEHVPSVRVSIGVGWDAWCRFLREQLYGTSRESPTLQRAAANIRTAVPANAPEARAAALVAWVGQNVEADDDLRDSASLSVARGRGNRLAVILALARELGLDARPALARSVLTADADAPAPLEEADDFAEPLVRFAFGKNKIFFVDPRLKHAMFGYLPPGLDGARVLVLDGASFETAHGRSDDHRAVDIAVRLDRQGGGVARAAETLRGWPALEWAEIVDRFGPDRAKLRQDFEQRWLGVQFPGAVLKDLEIEILDMEGRNRNPASLNAASGSVVDDAAPDAAGAPPPAMATSGAAAKPGTPYTAAQVRLRYSFSSSRFALQREREIRFLPTFFRAQPGRRYATESRRATALLTGFDVPLDLQARVELPEGGRFVEPQRFTDGGLAGGGARAGGAGGPPRPNERVEHGGYQFVEERRIERRTNGAPVLLLRREARLPIMRVPLADYASVADQLRRVDVLEQEEVRIGIGPERP